ncbi:MAG: L-threonylcarbamoyladenylate synthase [Spirochaetaceae bacterium]|jgi:L-threonylcarbamoyladenylate synthase|nr:L-threonylcarbamoyladenylate synthase [Spirochaetaceae bacterium]
MTGTPCPIVDKAAPGSVETAAKILRQGLVAVLPTDTIYGFSGLFPDCGQAIRLIKGREEAKPFIRLIARGEDIFSHTHAAIPHNLLAHWPGPLTLVVPVGQSQSAAFRCPGDQWLRHVIAAVGRPIYSTSVNRAGNPPLIGSAAILREFGTQIALMVVDDSPGGPPSTIYDVLSDKVLRQGAVNLS